MSKMKRGRKLSVRARGYWRRSRRFVKLHRVFSGAAAVILLASMIAATPLGDWLMTRPATLSAQELNLVGEVRDDAKTDLKYDSSTKAYSFSVAKNNDGGSDASQHTGRVDDAYSASFPASAKDGVVVTDTATNISVSMSPNFYSASVRKQNDGHLIYNSDKGKITYSLKYNGLKENIILSQAPKNGKESYSFTLKLPAGVEARLEADGGIGLYSADTTLFGNISYGSDADQAKVEKARENGAKTHLLMEIPYPEVNDSAGKTYTDKASFKLGAKQTEQGKDTSQKLPPGAPASLTTFNTYKLTVNTHDLKDLSYPIAIDPTMRVLSASDFSQVNPEAGVDVDSTNNLIRRSALTGGVLSSWTTDTSGYGTLRNSLASVAANGYIYVIGGIAAGGVSGQATTSVQYAPLDTTSCAAASTTNCIGAWQAATSLPVARTNPRVVYANGYLYMATGDDGVNAVNTVYFVKINKDGTLGSWTTNATYNLNNSRTFSQLLFYNGYLYVTGGCVAEGCGAATTKYATTEISRIQADGTPGSWTVSGNSFPTARTEHMSAIYNGYLYVMGGSDGATWLSSAYYTKINSDGTINAWTATTSLPGIRGLSGVVANSGYIYLVGGCNNASCSSLLADTQYAATNADGSLGTWRTTTSFATARWLAGTTFYQGYLFEVGGCTDNTAPCTNYTNDVQYTSIKSAGELDGNTWTTSGNPFSTARYGQASIVYNGFLYVLGGNHASSDTACNTVSTTYCNDVQFATLSSDGSISTWTSTTKFATGRTGLAAVAYNGYMYILGGDHGTSDTSCNATASSYCSDTQYAQINSNGTLGSWTATTSFSTPRGYLGAAAYNGYMYMLGGYNGGYFNDVQYAQINSNGTTGTWNSTTSFSTARFGHGVAVFNGYLYVIGGVHATSDTACNASASTICNDTQYALISSSNNTVGTWNSTTSFSTPRFGMIATVSKGYLYITGGCTAGNCTAYSNVVQYALINSNGTVGTWNSTTSFTTARDFHSGAIANGFLYVLGGFNGGYLNDVQYQVINNGGSGTLGSWTTDSTHTFTARYGHGSFAYNGKLYVIGGCTVLNSCLTGSNTLSSGVFATINSDGTLGAFSALTGSLSSTRFQFGLAVYNGYVYIVGGGNNGFVSTVEYGQINSSTGDIASFSTQTSLPGTRGGSPGTFAYNGYLYVLGGTTGTPQTTSYVTKLNSNGTIATPNFGGCGGATWCTTTALNSSGPETMLASNTIINNGYAYLIGGQDSSGNATTATYYAAINSDGTLGTWTATNQPPLAQYSYGEFISNGSIYRVGGDNGATGSSAVSYAPILPGGGLGTWQATTAMPLVIAESQAAFYQGRVYMTGGNSSGTLKNDTRYASVQSIPRVGSFSKYYDFGSGAAVQPTKIITRGTKQTGATVAVNYANNNNAGTTFGTAQTNSDISYAGANALAISRGTNVTLSRYFWLRYTIDDSLSAVFPDSGNSSTITNFDLYYHANTAKRLRGGQSFTNGNDGKPADRGLDTQ